MTHQSDQERQALLARWHADPKVEAFSESVEAFAWRNKLAYDAAGVSAVLDFASGWVKENGWLPDSGIGAT